MFLLQSLVEDWLQGVLPHHLVHFVRALQHHQPIPQGSEMAGSGGQAVSSRQQLQQSRTMGERRPSSGKSSVRGEKAAVYKLMEALSEIN